MLTDTQRKYLTEMLGERWCDDVKEYDVNYLGHSYNRTFTTPQDFFDVVRVLSLREVDDAWDSFPCSMSNGELMKQPDFIERFMSEVCEMKEVKG
jgi:hypothetical protein